MLLAATSRFPQPFSGPMEESSKAARASACMRRDDLALQSAKVSNRCGKPRSLAVLKIKHLVIEQTCTNLFGKVEFGRRIDCSKGFEAIENNSGPPLDLQEVRQAI